MQSPSELAEGDIPRGMPRLQSPHFEENGATLQQLDPIAACRVHRATGAGLVRRRAAHTLVIPGTTREQHLAENCGADAIRLNPTTLGRLEALLPPGKASGARYPPATQVENDTEDYGS